MIELKTIQELIESQHRELNAAWFHRAQGEPVIVIEQKMFDSFLDDIPVRILCQEMSSSRILCLFLTRQNQLIHEMTLKDIDDLEKVIDFIKVMDYVSCQGLCESKFTKNELRKCKLENIFIEKYGNEVILRSRKCSFICRGGNSSMELCHECRILQHSLEYTKINTEKTSEPVNCVQKTVGSPKADLTVPDPYSGEFLSLVNHYSVKEVPAAKIAAAAKEDCVSAKRRRGRPTVNIYNCQIPDCQLKFSNLISLKRHMKTDHPQNYRCKWQQSSCTRTFSTEAELNEHLKRHTGDLSFFCQHCGKGFLRERELTVHKRTHSGVKPYLCPVCRKKFGRSDQLKVHMSVHSDAKGYLCVTCGTSFTRQSHLIEHHKRAHVGEKRYKCNDCSKSFFAPQQLKRHKRTHTGERPYQCLLCGKKFSRSHHLSVHHKRLHCDTLETKEVATKAGAKAELDRTIRLPLVTEDGATITIQTIPGTPAQQITVTALDNVLEQVSVGIVHTKTTDSLPTYVLPV